MLQEQQTRRNALSKQVGEGKRAGADTGALEAEAAALRGEMEALQQRAEAIEADIRNLLERLPNVLDPDVPDGRRRERQRGARGRSASPAASTFRRASISSSARRWG